MLSHSSLGQLALPLLYLLTFRPAAALGNASAILPLKSVAYGTSYNTEVTFGDQTLWVIIDTGSADLWALGSNWQCFYGKEAPNGEPVSRAECRNGDQTYTESSTFEPIDWAWIGVHYGSGNVYGTLGFEDIKVGDLTVPQQITGVINATTSYFDDFGVGILGLGYPTISQIHPANYTGDTDLELLQDRLLYPTILQTMTKQGVEPYFAIALERTPLDLEIGFGM